MTVVIYLKSSEPETLKSNAKTRRHERRKEAAIARDLESQLSKKIGFALTGCSERVEKATRHLSRTKLNKTTTICSVVRKAEKVPGVFTAVARQKIRGKSIPLI